MNDRKSGCEALFEVGRNANDEPTGEDRARVAMRIAARLGVGTAAVSAAATVATVTSVHTASTGGAIASVSKAGWLFSLAKVVVPLAIGVGVATTAILATSQPSNEVVRAQAPGVDALKSRPDGAHGAPVTTRVSSPVHAAASVDPLPSFSAARSPRIEPKATAPAPSPEAMARSRPQQATNDTTPAPPAPASVQASGPAHEAPQYSVGDELRLLQQVDDAIRQRDFNGALRLLDEHDAKFPGGQFTEECASARVLAFCGLGSMEVGHRSACAFFSRYPHSPMRARIQDACSPQCGVDSQ